MRAGRTLISGLAVACLALSSVASWAAKQAAAPTVDPSFHYVDDVDADGKHVVFIATRRGRFFYYCAGSIIARQFILTAAHCVTTKARATTVYFGADMRRFQRPGRGTPVTGIAINPRYFEDEAAVDKVSYWWQDQHDADLAVIKLAREIPAGYSPLQLDYATTHEVDGRFSRNLASYSLGYGDLIAPSGKKRLDIRLKRKDLTGLRQFEYSNILLVLPGKDAYSICSGDSGGPIVLDDGSAIPRQIGVNSRADPRCQGTAAPAPVADSYDWIRDAMIALKAPDPVPQRLDYAGDCVHRGTSLKIDADQPYLEVTITNACMMPVHCIDAGWYRAGGGDRTLFKVMADLKRGEVHSRKLPAVRDLADAVGVLACSRAEGKDIAGSRAGP